MSAIPKDRMTARHVARALYRLALSRDEARRGMLLTEINGAPATTHALSAVFVEEGFAVHRLGPASLARRARLTCCRAWPEVEASLTTATMPEGDTIAQGREHPAPRARRPHHHRLPVGACPGWRASTPTTMRGAHGRAGGGAGQAPLIWFSGDLGIRTHMRMHGSWHLYRSGERWRRAKHEMRIVIATAPFEAVAFGVPVAELVTAHDAIRAEPLRSLGPDLLANDPDLAGVASRIADRAGEDIASVLLDQRVAAGIGNVIKSEVLFVAGVNPFVAAGTLSAARIERLVTTAVRLLRANLDPDRSGRSTTGWHTPGARLWVYGRAGRACRVCGTAIAMRRHGPHARSTSLVSPVPTGQLGSSP